MQQAAAVLDPPACVGENRQHPVCGQGCIVWAEYLAGLVLETKAKGMDVQLYAWMDARMNERMEHGYVDGCWEGGMDG